MERLHEEYKNRKLIKTHMVILILKSMKNTPHLQIILINLRNAKKSATTNLFIGFSLFSNQLVELKISLKITTLPKSEHNHLNFQGFFKKLLLRCLIGDL